MSPAAARPGGRRARAAVERARRDLDKASRALADRAAALLRVADEIAGAATEAERERLAASLVADRIPRDLLMMREALAAAPPGALPPSLEVVRRLPEMALYWLERDLGLVPFPHDAGEMHVPAERLGAFDLEGTRPEKGLVRLHIVSPGWKRGARVLARPVATLIG